VGTDCPPPISLIRLALPFMKDEFYTNLIKHWPILLFFLGMAVTWGRFETRINTIESSQIALELRQEKTSDVLNTLQGDIREIKTSLKFIEQKLQ
jgi:hypothetical protein